MKNKGNIINLAIAGVSVITLAVLFGIGFEIGRVGADKGVETVTQQEWFPKTYNARTVFVA